MSDSSDDFYTSSSSESNETSMEPLVEEYVRVGSHLTTYSSKPKLSVTLDCQQANQSAVVESDDSSSTTSSEDVGGLEQFDMDLGKKATVTQEAAAVVEPTRNKVTHISQVKPTEKKVVEMGQLSSSPSGSKKQFTALSTFSEKEIAQLKANEKQPQPLPRPISAKKKSNSNKMMKASFTAPRSDFTPLTQYSAKEIEAFAMKQKNESLQRFNAQKVESTTKMINKKKTDSVLTSLSSCSKAEIEELEKREEEKVLYGLKHFSTLSEKKQSVLTAKQPQPQPQQSKVSNKSVTPLSHPYFDASMSGVNIQDMTIAQLMMAVQECRAHHGDMKGKKIVSSTPPSSSSSITIKGVSAALGTRTVIPHIVTHTKTHITATTTTPTPSPVTVKSKKNNKLNQPILHNINSLPPKERQEILNQIAMNSKPINNNTAATTGLSFKNPSTLAAKKEFEVKLSSKMMAGKPQVLSLYHGLSLKKNDMHLSCPVSDAMAISANNGDLTVMEHLMDQHPLYASLLKKVYNDEMLEQLMKGGDNDENDYNVLFIVPSKDLMALYRQQGELISLLKTAIGYLTVILPKNVKIPIDNMEYEYTNMIGDKPITIRALDDDTLVLDDSRLAKLDPTSKGRVYMIEDVPQVEDLDDQEQQDMMNELIMAFDKQSAEDDAEEKKIDAEEDDDDDEDEPKATLLLTLPSKEEIEPVPVEVIPQQATTTVPTKSVVLLGVFKNSPFKNRKFETLATKMFNTSYNGAKDMASYIDHSPTSQTFATQLFLKTFNCDALYEKYRNHTNAMAEGTRERLTPDGSFRLEHQQNLTYGLDSTLQMKEFVIDTSKMKIKRSQLMNHLNVLTFKTKKDNQYATTSFVLPSDNASLPADVYMSADENLLLKFKDNLLQSVAINTNSAALTLNSIKPERHSVLGQDANLLKHITASVPMSNKLYETPLDYTQFTATVLPLAGPGIFDRIRNVFREVVGSESLLLHHLHTKEMKEFEQQIASYNMVGDNNSDKIQTVSIRASIGQGVLKAAYLKNYQFDRTVLKSNVINHYLVHYESTGKFLNFDELVIDRSSSPGVLSIELLHPLERKNKLFRFRLSHLNKPSAKFENVLVYQAKTKDDLIFDFQLNAKGMLTDIYIRYTRQNPLKSRFERDVAKFLANEAYAYKKHGLDIASNYMRQRLDNYLKDSGLTRENLDAAAHREFFTSLNKEITQYMQKEKMDTLLSGMNEPLLDQKQAVLLLSTKYQTPRSEESQQYKTILLAGFAPLSTSTVATPSNTLKLAIREYRHLSGSPKLVKDLSFARYLDRFRYITGAMSNAFVGSSK